MPTSRYAWKHLAEAYQATGRRADAQTRNCSRATSGWDNGERQQKGRRNRLEVVSPLSSETLWYIGLC